MGKPDTTAHGLAGIIGELNEDYEEEYGDKIIKEGGSLTGYTFKYDGRSHSVTSDINNVLKGMVTDGQTLLLLDDHGGNESSIHQYSFGSSWDVSTLSYDNESKYIGGEIDEPYGMDTDGDTLLVPGFDNERIHQYSFGSAWDISTLSYDNKDHNSGSEDVDPTGVTTDGSTLILLGTQNDSLFQYTFGTEWDVSTLSYDNVSFDVSGRTTAARGLFSDGKYLLYNDTTSDVIQQYSFGTEWDISTLNRDVYIDMVGDSSLATGISSGNGVAVISDPNNVIYSHSFVPEVQLPER